MRAIGGRASSLLLALVVVAANAALSPPAVTARDKKVTCVLDGATYMAFGAYDTMSNSPLDMQGRVSYRCYKDKSTASGAATFSDEAETRSKLTVQIKLSAGNSGSFNRGMGNGEELLHYNLYLDAQHQRVWGDGSPGTHIFSEPA